MIMTFRWFGTGFDTIDLWKIRQIPGVKGVITTLYDKQAGELWEASRIQALKKECAENGLEISGIESVNIHDDIKAALPDRDKYIDNYIKTLEMLGKEGIRMVCYNFMPVFDWTRSELAKLRKDGSSVLAYNQNTIDQIDPEKMFERLNADSNGSVLPGWEPERMSKIKALFETYKGVDDAALFNNLVYFLKAIMPVCNKYNIKMAIHPDDPAWPVFGLPRIINSKKIFIKCLMLLMTYIMGLPCVPARWELIRQTTFRTLYVHLKDESILHMLEIFIMKNLVYSRKHLICLQTGAWIYLNL